MRPHPVEARSGVQLKRVGAGLAIAGAVAAVYFRFLRPWHLNWGATAEEARGEVAGDELIPQPDVQSTRVVEIDAPPSAIWPWLVQMGPGRGGAYTYDWIERRLGIDIRNTDRVIPELQHLAGVINGIDYPREGLTLERMGLAGKDPQRNPRARRHARRRTGRRARPHILPPGPGSPTLRWKCPACTIDSDLGCARDQRETDAGCRQRQNRRFCAGQRRRIHPRQAAHIRQGGGSGSDTPSYFRGFAVLRA